MARVLRCEKGGAGPFYLIAGVPNNRVAVAPTFICNCNISPQLRESSEKLCG